MRKIKVLVASAAAASALSASLVLPAAPGLRVSPALAATGARYEFELATANTAASPDGGTMCGTTMAGDWISLKGSGTFDASAGTVRAKGSYVHYRAGGGVACQGTWKASAFGGFTGFGTDDRGAAGGVLSMVVTHDCTTMDMTMTGIPMTVTSTVNAPDGYIQGTTVGDFTQPTGGTVVIEPEQ
jgi:hypothetical protein